MKTRLLTLTAALALALTARATIVINDTWTVNQSIPDGSAVGTTAAQTFSGLDASSINGVEVSFTTTGGYNGDLYGYLVLRDANGNATSALLLNRVGTTGSDPFGSDGSGFNHITLSDAGMIDIHSVNPGSGNAVGTGTYLADQSLGANSLNSTYAGSTANGTWTLFLADLSGGEQATLVSWGLTVSVVPEPVTWALGIFSVLLAAAWIRHQRRPTAAH
ncbi:MAG: hypothetical protein RL380_603 [Verrucomicrobiota bacterium]|jgi:hypothetical protein